MRTARRPRFGAGRLGHAASPPARALDRPRNDVLEPAKDGAAPAGRLIGAKAIVGVDVVPAPRARLAVQQIDAEKVVRSRRARGDLSQPYANTQRQRGLRRGDSAASRDQSLLVDLDGALGVEAQAVASGLESVAGLTEWDGAL